MKRLMRCLAVLALVTVPLAAQKPARGLRATIQHLNVAADSAGFGWELWYATRVAQTGDSLPGAVGVGKLLGSRFSAEVAVSAHSVAGALEGDFTAGLTAAVFPGSTNLHGEAVYGYLVNHRAGSAWQWGVQFGTLLRVVGPDGISARTGPYYRYLTSHGALPSQSGVGAVVAVAFNL